ncbi:MAG TPA: tetratricopeptide repeat protein [Longimicrobiales bacterium]|jgi:tetratricopeptide (TPR) repeat protein
MTSQECGSRRGPIGTVAPVLAAALLALVASGARAQSVDLAVDLAEARDLLRTGSYDAALGAFADLARGDATPPVVLGEYARALMEVGRYDRAREVVEGSGGRARAPELENVLGEAWYATGRIAEAEAAFRRAAATSPGPIRNVGRLNLAVLLWNRGEREPAREIFDAFIDVYNGGAGRLSAEELMAVGVAVKHLAVRNPLLLQDALMAFDDAAAADPTDLRPDFLAAELFLEKYRATDARDAYNKILAVNPGHPRVLLGQARVLDFEGEGGAVEAVNRALEVNPDYVEARAFLASLHLKTEDQDRARSEARLALEVNPSSLEALSVLAASHYLSGDVAGYDEARRRIHELNPTYPDLYTTVAELAADRRQYQAAVELAAQAVEVDPSSWKGFGLLGTNQLRTGRIEEGRANLERAFEGDPYNPWYKNSLDLLDTFVHYETLETEHFRLFLHGREAELLGPYAAELAEEGFAALRERYGMEPPTPIRVEIFPSHEDFSVRTLGIPGLGALGVSFGSTLVMDSPSARAPGEFNWASTFWHELAHAFHLGMTDHRVPRWFSEGLAVHEQRVARERWGHHATPAFLQAYRDGRLHPVSRLNEGFIRPTYPQQVAFSYYQASLVFDLMESRWGFDSVLAMLRGYRDGRTTEELIPDVLGLSVEDLDEAFDAYVNDRLGERMAAVATVMEGMPPMGGRAGHDVGSLRDAARRSPGSFQARLALGIALFEAGELEDAERELRAALRLFPEYGGTDSPYLYLARIHVRRGESADAAGALYQLGRLSESHYEVHTQEADIRLALGEPEAAARALEKAIEIYPYDLEAHRRLASLHEEMGEHDREVRERRAVLSLDPVDRADAHYRLASALARAGRPSDARREVLAALEIAPNFEDALELLLVLRGGAG